MSEEKKKRRIEQHGADIWRLKDECGTRGTILYFNEILKGEKYWHIFCENICIASLFRKNNQIVNFRDFPELRRGARK